MGGKLQMVSVPLPLLETLGYYVLNFNYLPIRKPGLFRGKCYKMAVNRLLQRGNPLRFLSCLKHVKEFFHHAVVASCVAAEVLGQLGDIDDLARLSEESNLDGILVHVTCEIAFVPMILQ